MFKIIKNPRASSYPGASLSSSDIIFSVRSSDIYFLVGLSAFSFSVWFFYLELSGLRESLSAIDSKLVLLQSRLSCVEAAFLSSKDSLVSSLSSLPVDSTVAPTSGSLQTFILYMQAFSSAIALLNFFWSIKTITFSSSAPVVAPSVKDSIIDDVVRYSQSLNSPANSSVPLPPTVAAPSDVPVFKFPPIDHF